MAVLVLPVARISGGVTAACSRAITFGADQTTTPHAAPQGMSTVGPVQVAAPQLAFLLLVVRLPPLPLGRLAVRHITAALVEVNVKCGLWTLGLPTSGSLR